MITSESIELVLNEYWPDECEEIGPGNVRRIVRASGKISIEQAEGGAYLDLSAALQFVAAIATILQLGLDIYVIVKEYKNAKPTTSEILHELSANIKQMSKLSPKNQEKIADAILKIVNNN